MTKNRNDLIEGFLNANGWERALRQTLADDASFRRYERITDGSRCVVLMDAPPDKENVELFIDAASDLNELGCKVPAVLASDKKNGFLLLEDFGNKTYSKVLQQNPTRERELYSLAVDVLIHLQKQIRTLNYHTKRGSYNNDILINEACVLLDWYFPKIHDKPIPEEGRTLYVNLWNELLNPIFFSPSTIVHRDFHIDNLVLLKGESGISGCGLLDFQDALIGSGIYDLMSLLEDARRDVTKVLQSELKNKYFCEIQELGIFRAPYAVFETNFAILAANRHAKVLGVFSRLATRDNKEGYLDHIPRVWGLLEAALNHPKLAGLKFSFDKYFPKSKRPI